MESAYKDVAAHAAHEQDAWSNPSGVQSPMRDLLSPVKDAKEIQVDSSNKLSDLINTEPQFDDRSLLTAIKESFPEELPKSTHESGSNSEMSHYFPKVEDLKGKAVDTTNLSVSEIERRATSSRVTLDEIQVEPPVITTDVPKPNSTLGSLWDQIKSRRNEADIIDGVRKENIIVQEVAQADVINTQPEVTKSETPKSGLSGLGDQIKSRRNDSNIIDDTTKENITQEVAQSDVINTQSEVQPEITITQEEQPEITASQVKTGFDSLFDQIKSKRLEYGSPSPKISQVGLATTESPQMLSPLKSKPSLSNLFGDTEALFDDEEDIIAPQVVEGPSTSTITDNTRHRLRPSTSNYTLNRGDGADVAFKNKHWYESEDNPFYHWEDRTIVVDPAWDKVTYDLKEGAIELDFKDLWHRTKEVHITSRHGHQITYKIDPDNIRYNLGSYASPAKYAFDWAEKMKGLPNFDSSTPLKEVFITDNSGKMHLIANIK
jgi:hypothetical protein